MSKKRSFRDPKVKVRTARGRKNSSTRWLQRQLNDPYVGKAQVDGYASRAAYKLIELNDKFDFLKKGQNIVDLGAAPGGWSQVASQHGATVVAIDLLEMGSFDNVTALQMDFMDDEAPAAIRAALTGSADIVMSDMAPNTTGHRQTDHLKIMALVEAAYDFACEVLHPGGWFIAKVRQGGTQNEILARVKQNFTTVRHFKPPASRAESSETYLVASGFKG